MNSTNIIISTIPNTTATNTQTPNVRRNAKMTRSLPAKEKLTVLRSDK